MIDKKTFGKLTAGTLLLIESGIVNDKPYLCLLMSSHNKAEVTEFGIRYSYCDVYNFNSKVYCPRYVVFIDDIIAVFGKDND